MSLNHAEIDRILAELSLEGSYIQNIVQSSYDTIAFYTYSGNESLSRVVQVCLAPGVCRLHETRTKVPKNDTPLRFMEFLRSRVKGSRITGAEQIDHNRIIRFTLTHGDETLYMYIRLWSGAANIVVTDAESAILDVFYRRPKKGEVSGGNWVMPEPKNDGIIPDTVYTARELPGEGTYNEKIDKWYAEHASSLSREALLDEARKRHEKARTKLLAALGKLEKKREGFLNADRYRHLGDLLTANLFVVKTGQSSIVVSDYENDNTLIEIALDNRLKPQENAFHYYELYKKAVSGLGELEADIQTTRNTIESLASELEVIERETNPLIIHNTLRKQNKPKQQIEKRYPGLTFRKDGWILLVGRTAVENDELLRHHVKGSDLWLHTRDWPGGYVFIKNHPGKSIPLEILLDAGTLALFYSKGRKAGTADLYYTHVKYLRRAKNAPKGTVLPANEKNLTIRLDGERLKKLETCRDE